MSALIEVENLRYRYDDGTAALDGVSFRLQEGETVALLGPNGSGKTTFALHLNGLLTGEGRVSVCGIEVGPKTAARVRRHIGIVFQDSDEQLFMPTVIEDVMFGPLNLGMDGHEAYHRAEEMLARVGMSHALGKAPYHLSAGEKRRVAVAGVLATRPDILVLDEPTTYLDPPGERELTRILRELPQAKILITHNSDFACALAQRAVFFERGRIAGEGPVEDIVRRFRWSARE